MARPANADNREINLIHPLGLQLRFNTPKGRGVFATRKISAGETVDISPVLLFPKHESDRTILAHYTFSWPAQGDKVIPRQMGSQEESAERIGEEIAKVPRQALALGLGSMFNHNRTPNVAWERQLSTESIRYFTIRDIEAGQELCISYGPKLWFEDTDAGPMTDETPDDETNDISLTRADVFD